MDLNEIANFALFSDANPIHCEEACKDKKWQHAMDEEIKAIEKNDMWDLVDLPKCYKSIGLKWIYKTKLIEKGEINKFKARLVVKACKQKQGIYFQDVFALVICMETIKLVPEVASYKG